MANEHDLLPKKASEKERSKDPKYDRLKTIMKNPRKVSLEDIETGEIKTFPSIYKAGKFIGQAPQMIIYWDGTVWKNKYKIEIQYFFMFMYKQKYSYNKMENNNY